MVPKEETPEEKRERIVRTKNEIRAEIENSIKSHHLGENIKIGDIFYRKGCFYIKMAYRKSRRSRKKFFLDYHSNHPKILLGMVNEFLEILEIHGK